MKRHTKLGELFKSPLGPKNRLSKKAKRREGRNKGIQYFKRPVSEKPIKGYHRTSEMTSDCNDVTELVLEAEKESM